jgi:Do/DeqQ family serine protease
VIVDAREGIVVTHHHVVNGADEIHVGLQDGRSLKAELVGSDPEVDIAVLKVPAEKLAAVKLADSDKTQVGDFVVAIGNPFGLGQTVTTGVVSALGRSGLGIEGYEDFIQTDASINPGNSGGALINLRGELIGINTAIIAPGGGNIGIGFAIPANMAKNSVDQILEFGAVKRGQLGVSIQDLTPELARAFDFKAGQRGVVVAEVQAGSSADKAGVQPGDVVVSVDGKAIDSAAQLRNEIGARRIGDNVKLTLLRDGRSRVVPVKIGEPQAAASAASVHRFLEGATLQDDERGRGVVVSQIAPGSPAAGTGLRVGDLIVSANRQPVKRAADLQQAAKASKDQLLLRVVRGNAALFLVLQ